MLRKFLILLTATSSLYMMSAQATPLPFPGLYVGFQLGAGAMNMPKFPGEVKEAIRTFGGSSSEHNHWNLAGRLFGGYLWHKNKFQYGLELGGMRYPSNEYKFTLDNVPEAGTISVDMKYTGYLIDLLGVAKYNVTPSWNLFVKEGIAYTYQKYKGLRVVTGAKKSETTIKRKHEYLPEIAVGVGYHIVSWLELNLNYHHVFGNDITLMDGDDSRSKVASVDGVMLGVTAQL